MPGRARAEETVARPMKGGPPQAFGGRYECHSGSVRFDFAVPYSFAGRDEPCPYSDDS